MNDNPPTLFLDIDGVLIAYPEGEHTPPMFTPRCVEAFRSILDAVPGLRVVFSTTWRLPLHVNRLHEQWLAHGFSEDLTIDGTPDTRDEPAVPRMYRRGNEIRIWLERNRWCRNWAVLDDEQLSIEPVIDTERCVFTDPGRGLEFWEAERVIKILRGGD